MQLLERWAEMKILCAHHERIVSALYVELVVSPSLRTAIGDL
jgi:hypothetical protein